MPPSQFQALGSDTGAKAKSGHVSGRAVPGVVPVKGPAGPGEDVLRGRQASHEQRFDLDTVGVYAVPPPDVGTQQQPSGAITRGVYAPAQRAGSPPTSEDSYEPAPPRRSGPRVNAELVQLVASFAPLELAQLKALKQKARIQRAVAAAPAQPPEREEFVPAEEPAPDYAAASGLEGMGEPSAGIFREASAASMEHGEGLGGHQYAAGVRQLARRSSGGGGYAAHTSSRSRSPSMSSHLPAAPAKGAIVKRDLHILPNPVAQKQAEAMQRQAAQSAYVHRLQREQDAIRGERERRLKAEQEALAEQLAAEAEARRAEAAAMTEVPAPKPIPVKRKKAVPSSAPGLQGLQAAAVEEPERKPVDPKPWRHNMRKRPTPTSGDAPVGAPPEVAARPATDAPPPRNISPGAAAARMRTLDPVARSQLKEFMERRSKEMAAKQEREKMAAQEARVAQLKVIKEEMVKARERAQHYAESSKAHPPQRKPRPAWVDTAPEGGTAPSGAGGAALGRLPQRGPQHMPDLDVVSERALPHHMSDAMRVEAAQRRRQARRQGASATRPVIDGPQFDDFGFPIPEGDEDAGPQVIRMQDPEPTLQPGRVYREGSVRPTRPLMGTRPASSHPVSRPSQGLEALPVGPTIMRAMELEARLAARKQFEQKLRAEQRDTSAGRDTSRGRDNSRGRRRSSPSSGRRASSSRSPTKRTKAKRRSRSGSRASSANRKRPQPVAPPAAAYHAAVGPVAGGFGPAGYEPIREAHMQQAHNEQQVGDLWELALQLSARLGALQQNQQMQQGPPLPMQAWPEVQQPGSGAVSGGGVGALAQAVAVPTALPPAVRMDGSLMGSPARVGEDLQFDEAVQAEIDFRSEHSAWPASTKRARLAGVSHVTSTAATRGSQFRNLDVEESVPRVDSVPSLPSQSLGGASSVPEDMDVAVLGPGSLPSQGSLGQPVSTGKASSRADALSGGRASAAARSGAGPRAKEGSSSSSRKPADEVDKRSGRFSVTLPASPSKPVPAAPIIQIPMPPASAEGAASGVEPSPGLPYDNAAFSAESASDGENGSGRSSSGQSSYGQRVLTIGELHNMLEENPHLAQRLTLDRERERWEEHEGEDDTLQRRDGDAGRSKTVQIAPSPPRVRTRGSEQELMDDSSVASSAPNTPARACETIVAEYEKANSPLRLRPAQQELLKALTAKRAEEQLQLAVDQHLEALAAAEEEARDAEALPLPKSGDPMSIINLIAHKGRPPTRPAIIQLSAPPLADDGTGEQPQPLSATELVVPVATVSDGAAAAGFTVPVPAPLPPAPAAEVLMIPGAAGPQLVFSRGLVQPQASPPVSPLKTLRETGVGNARVDAPEYDMLTAQQLYDSMPPYVLVPPQQPMAPLPSAEERLDLLGIHQQQREAEQLATAGSLSEQLQRLGEVRSEGGASPPPLLGAASAAAALAGSRIDSVGGATVGGSTGGVSGVMASPPTRRTVHFSDEAQGLGDKVRLAPHELYRQMQDTLRSLEELDSAERDLAQLQNARAIAAVQREAHRIAQRLDQTASTEAHLALYAQSQADMETKLRSMEDNLRSQVREEAARNLQEVRKESLNNLHEVASIFVQQLSKNKVAHATVQTYSPPPPQPLAKPEVGIQVDSFSPLPSAPHPVSILRGTAASPIPQLPLQSILRGSSPSPPSTARPQSAGGSPAPAYTSGLGGGLPPPAPSTRSRRPSFATTVLSEYTEDFEDADTVHAHSRAPSRLTQRQASTMSVPATTYDDDFEDVEEEDGVRSRRARSQRVSVATSIQESISYQPSRVTIRQQPSSMSIAESIMSERQPSRQGLRGQASNMSVPESVFEEDEEDEGAGARSRRLGGRSVASIPETIRSEGTALTSRHGAASHRRSSVAESVAYTSVVGGDSREFASSVQESLVDEASGRTGATRATARTGRGRRHSTVTDTVGSEPGYSMEFEVEDDVQGGATTSQEIEEEDSRSPTKHSRLRGRSGSVLTESVGVSTEEPQSYESEEPGTVTASSSGRLQPPVRTPGPKPLPTGSSGAVRTPQPRMGAAASPLDLRASIEGGLELDNAMMSSYIADVEASMKEELSSLKERLRLLDASASRKMADLEAQLAAETHPQRQHAIIRAQRLVQVQHDADASELQRRISALKADYARQQLLMERLYRLADITSPAAMAAKAGGASPAPDRAGKQRPAPAAKTAPVAPPKQRPPSRSDSIVEEVSEGPAVGRSGSVVSDVAEEYSEDYESGSIMDSRPAGAPVQRGRPPRPQKQSSSVMDEIEENLSHRRLGASATYSQSIMEEEAPAGHRSGSSGGTGTVATGSGDGRSGTQAQRSSGSEPGTEAGYSEDYEQQPSAPGARRTRPPPVRRSTAASTDNGLGSELSVLSADLEQQQQELQRMLRRKEKELQQEERRAKVLAKQAAVEEMQRKLAELERRAAGAAAGAAAPGKKAAPSRPSIKPVRRDSSVVESEPYSEDGSSQQRSADRTVTESVADEYGSGTVESLPGAQGRRGRSSEVSESIRSETPASSAHGRARRRVGRSASEVSESVAYTEPEGTEEPGSEVSYESSAAASHRRKSASRSGMSSSSKRLTALQQAVLAKEKELRRLQRQAEEEALQRRLQELEAQAKALKAKPAGAAAAGKPPLGPSGASAAAAIPRPSTARRATNQSYGTSANTTAYSEEFEATASVSESGGVYALEGGQSSGSVLDEVPSSSMGGAARGRAAAAGASGSMSVVDELGSADGHSANPLQQTGGVSGDVYEEEEEEPSGSRSRLGTSGSSGRGRAGRSASVSEEHYEASFESESAHGIGALRDASEVLDEVGDSGAHEYSGQDVHLEPIDEEGAVVQEYASRYSRSHSGSEGEAPAGGSGDVDEEDLGEAEVEYSGDEQGATTSIQDFLVTAQDTMSVGSRAAASAHSVEEVAAAPSGSERSHASLGGASIAYSDEALVVQQHTPPSSQGERSIAEEDEAYVVQQRTPPSSQGERSIVEEEEEDEAYVVQQRTPPSSRGDGSVVDEEEEDEAYVVQQRTPPSSRGDGSVVDEADGAEVSYTPASSGEVVEETGEVASQSRSAAKSADDEVEGDVSYGEDYEEDIEVAEEGTRTLGVEDEDQPPSTAQDEDGDELEDAIVVQERSSGSDEEEEQGLEGEVEYEDDLEPATESGSREVVQDATGLSAVEETRDLGSDTAEVTYDASQLPTASVLPETSQAAESQASTQAEDVDDYELDFQGSAAEVEAEAEGASPRESRGSAAGSSAGGEVQGASDLAAQTSLAEVPSAVSVSGSTRVPAVTSASSLTRATAPLPQQASSVSAATYEEDFEEGEASELQVASGTDMERTALSVVDEEAEHGATASRLYSEDFATASTALPTASGADVGAAPPLAAAEASAAASASASAEEPAESVGEVDVPEDVDIEYDQEDEQEDDGPYAATSGALSGPVLVPAAAAAAAAATGAEGARRYGPASPGSSGGEGYSEDFAEEPEAEATQQESEGGSAAASEGGAAEAAATSAAQAEETDTGEARQPHAAAPEADESGSVFSVVEDGASGTVSSEASAVELPAAVEPSAKDARAAVLASAEDDYTQDFGEVTGAIGTSEVEGQPAPLQSHPISQPVSQGGSDGEQEEEPQEEVAEEVEVEEEEGEGADLDMSDLGLDVPRPAAAAAAAAPEAAETPATLDEPHDEEQESQDPTAFGGYEGGFGDPELEDSGIIVVPRGRGIRQTRNIESRIWRNHQALLEEEDEDSEGLEGKLDLVDMSMTAGEGGLLEMLGADFVEDSEALTPTHSFRLRTSDIGPGLRSSLSHRLATLREQCEETATDSEVDTPTRAEAGAPEAQAEGEDAAAAERASAAGPEAEEEPEEMVEEEVVKAVSEEQEEAAEDKVPAPPTAEAKAREKSEEEEQQQPEPAAAAPAPAGEPSEESYGGFEAPSETSSRQEVMQVDVSLLEEDSDDLAMVAAAFESQAIGGDDEDEEVAAEMSRISASGLSDELLGMQVTVHPESDEEAATLPAPSAAEVAAAAATASAPAAPAAEPSDQDAEQEEAEQEEEEVEEELEVVEEEPDAAAQDPFAVDESIEKMPSLKPAGSAGSATARAAPAAPPSDSKASDSGERAAAAAASEAAAGQQSSPTVSSPRSSKGLPEGETSLGPLPRSGLGLLGGDEEDEDDEEGGLQYRALYAVDSAQPTPRATEPAASSSSPFARPPTISPVLTAAGEVASARASTEVPMEQEGGDLLDQLRAFAASDEEDGEGSGMFSRGLSAASLKPAFQALLDAPASPESAVPKGTFESEIEEMLAASRSKSRLVSPYTSRDWGADSEQHTPEILTPYSQSTRASLAGSHAGLPQPPATASVLQAAAAAMGAASERESPATSLGGTPELGSGAAGEGSGAHTPLALEFDTDVESVGAASSTAALLEPGPPTREEMADEWANATARELVTDAIEAMVGVAGPDSLPSTQAAGAAAVAAAAALAAAAAAAVAAPMPGSPRGSLASVQLQQAPKHRLAQSSSFHISPETLAAVEAGGDGEEGVLETGASAAAVRGSVVSTAGATEGSGAASAAEASLSISADDLDADIEIEEDVEVEGDEAVDLPSPLPSDSGSLGSPVRQTAFEPPGASKLGAPPLAPEPSDRDLARAESGGDDGEGATSGGMGLVSDEDLGWGGAEEDAELEENWQPDLSGYIAPEIDQATIERENAPAVSTSAEAVSTYVEQVLEQFMEGRPEVLVAGAEPLSLEGFLAQERRLADATEAQHIHNKMLYDAVNEALLTIYRAANRVQPQGPSRRARVVKPLPGPKEMAEQVQAQIKAWSSMRMREAPEIDKVLAGDAQEDERMWSDLGAEEAEVAKEVAELIWNDLIADAAQSLSEVEGQLSGGGAASASSSRRRLG